MDEDATVLFLTRMLEQAEMILAEIVRISGFVGKDFVGPEKSKFRKFLMDFKYFQKADYWEKEFEKELKLQTLFYSTHGPVFTAFEQVFNLIPEFVQSFSKYSEIGKGNLMAGEEEETIAELEIELVYTTGLLFLNLEKLLPAAIRERIYVAIYRRCATRQNAEFLVDFLAATTSTDTFFKRSQISVDFVRGILTRIEREQLAPRHKRAQFMYVALLFDKHTLDKDSTRMAQICAMVFREEWVFNLGYNIIINLFDAWYYNKSAWYAMNSQIRTVEANRIAENHLKILKSWKLSKSIEVSDFPEVLKQISNFNLSLKWLILHCRSQRYKIIKNPPSSDQFFTWILEISKVELEFLRKFRVNLKNRASQFEEGKERICELLKKLADFFEMGFVSVNQGQKENFLKWLTNLSETIKHLKTDQEDLILQIQRRLKNSSDLLGLDANFTIKELLEKIDSALKNLKILLKLSENSRNQVLRKMEADYLWTIMEDELIPKIQQNFFGPQFSVTAIFTKLSISIRVFGQRMKKLRNFSENLQRKLMSCWSAILEQQLRKVLQIVPKSVFDTMRHVILPKKYISNNLGVENYVEKSVVFERVRNERDVVRATYKIANMSQGISRMMMRKVGTVEINPKKLLEDGIERELYREIKRVIGSPTEIGKFVENLRDLQKMREAFIYVCEFMNLNGNLIWTRAVEDYFGGKLADDGENFMVEMVKRATQARTSRFSSDLMVWKDLKGRKTQFSYDMIYNIERMVPFHPTTSMENAILVELETGVKEHLQTCRKIMLTANLPNPSAWESIFGTADFDKMLKFVHANLPQLTAQISQIGQFLLILRGIGEMKRICGEIHENRIFKELRVSSRKLVELPQVSRNLLRLFAAFSMYDVAKVRFEMRDEMNPVLMMAVIQAIAAKIGDPNFVCPEQFSTGFLFILHQSKMLPILQAILREKLPELARNLHKKRNFGGFLDGLISFV